MFEVVDCIEKFTLDDGVVGSYSQRLLVNASEALGRADKKPFGVRLREVQLQVSFPMGTRGLERPGGRA